MKLEKRIKDLSDEFDPEVAELAIRMWSVHPRELQDANISRPYFYAQEIQKLLDKYKRDA